MKTIWYHLLALAVVAVWGTTFISTKVLLARGLSAADIFFYRFLFAAVGMWVVAHRKLWADSWRDELRMVLLGASGGSLYFLAENSALGITQASNVSLLVCTAPLLTALLSQALLSARSLTRRLLQGSLLALVGVALVAYNGQLVLRFSPWGDGLSLLAALCWAVYTIALQRMSARYSTLFLTRKIFSYGVITLLPVLPVHPLFTDMATLAEPVVLGNLLFLGAVASLACYFAWNVVVKHIGGIRANNYIYAIPPVTLVASAIVLNEIITPLAIAGAALILGGMVWAEKK